MKMRIEFTNGQIANFTGENALKIEDAICRAINIGDQATNLVRLNDDRHVRVFMNSINCTVIEY